MLRETDATAAAIWQRLPITDARHGYQFAKAWFGNQAEAWLVAGLALGHHLTHDDIVDFLALGLSRSADLAMDAEVWLKALDDAGITTNTIRKALGAARTKQPVHFGDDPPDAASR